MLGAHIRSRMFEIEEVRTWERNPQFYADLIASSLAGQALFTHASAPERARRVLSKLRQTPRLIQAARDNIKDPPGIFVKVGIETMRGALKFIDEDLPRAFSSLDDMHLLGDLADAQSEASHAVGAYIEYLETEVAPKARASFRLGADKFEQKVRLDEGVLAAARSPPRDRHARAEGHAGGVQERGGTDERRRSARDLGAHQGRAPRPRASCVNVGREQLGGAANVSRTPVDHHAAAGRSRSPSRRRPISTGGRSPACGRRGRSKASRRAPTTT